MYRRLWAATCIQGPRAPRPLRSAEAKTSDQGDWQVSLRKAEDEMNGKTHVAEQVVTDAAVNLGIGEEANHLTWRYERWARAMEHPALAEQGGIAHEGNKAKRGRALPFRAKLVPARPRINQGPRQTKSRSEREWKRCIGQLWQRWSPKSRWLKRVETNDAFAPRGHRRWHGRPPGKENTWPSTRM